MINKSTTPAKLLMVFALALGGALTACQKKETSADRSIDANGNCTYAYVTHYNRVITSTESLGTAYDAKETTEATLNTKLAELQDACMTMASEHKNINCSAKSIDGKETASVKYEDLRANCSGVFEKIKANQGKPTAEKPFSGKEAKTKYISIFELDYLTEE